MRNLFMAIAAVLGTSAMVTAAPAPVKKAPAKEVKATPQQDTKATPSKEEKAAKHSKHHNKKAKSAKTEAPKPEASTMK
ncbi:hypothetical protein [Flavobacterium mesophilum]|uniref:hypothetical protein n=1 Tax=Flavobacterium mesophilum TaxID=3143495 RepID=UPI0031D7DBFA